MPFDILVAEDSATQAEQIRVLLERERYHPTVARSGEEALERLEDGHFDLLLTDVVMPGISGYDLCKKVKADRPDLPVVLLTSLVDPLDIVRGLEAGADNYITKPYEAEYLLARLRRVIDNRQLRSSVRTTMGVNFTFLGNAFTITSGKEQILDLLLSSVEDTVRTNRDLEAQQRELANAHAQLELYATEQAREARRSTERYRSLMQNAGEAIFVLDESGVVIEANAYAAELLNRPVEQALYRPLSELLGETDAADLLDTMRGEGHTGSLTDLRLRRLDGADAWVDLSTSTVRLEDEVLTLAIIRDVTERQRADERQRATLANLRESEGKLRTLVKASPVAIVLLDSGLRVRSWNDAAESMFGWSAEEVMGEPLPFMEEGDVREHSLALQQRVLQGESIRGVELRRSRRDGTAVEVSLSAAPFRDAAGEVNGIVGILIDITERKHREEELRQAQRLEAIGRLTGGVAHDFNNVLSTIQGSTQLLLLDLTGDDALREELEEIQRAATRATALTRQLLAFSRKQVLQTRVLDLNKLIREMHGMLHRLLGEDVDLRLELDPDIGRIRADAAQIEQVVMNLIVNARDAMPGGGVIDIRTGKVDLDSPEPGRDAAPHVLLTVRDSGQGMTPDVRERLFEPFFTTKAERQGTGLGLSTVYGIVHQSGGDIDVDSEVGIGSTFRIRLPSVEDEPDEEPAQPATSPPQGSETVVVVEDDRSVRSVASRILERYGYTVLGAPSGADALDIVDQHDGPIDLVITDLMMPGMSGRELAEHLAREKPSVPVLYISGYSEDSMMEGGIEPIDVPLLEKPFTPDALVRRVRDMLDRHVREG